MHDQWCCCYIYYPVIEKSCLTYRPWDKKDTQEMSAKELHFLTCKLALSYQISLIVEHRSYEQEAKYLMKLKSCQLKLPDWEGLRGCLPASQRSFLTYCWWERDRHIPIVVLNFLGPFKHILLSDISNCLS